MLKPSGGEGISLNCNHLSEIATMHKVNVIDGCPLSNRQKVQRMGKDKFWCWGCDANLVGEIGKCPVCGWDNSTGRRLKHQP